MKNGNKTAIECNSNKLSFFPLKLSDAGEYICEVTIETDSNNLTLNDSHHVMIQSELTFTLLATRLLVQYNELL